MKHYDLSRAAGYYSDDFFATTPQSEWRRSMERIRDELGELVSVKIVSTNTASQLNLGGKTDITQYDCEVQYAKFPATMRVVIRRRWGNDPRIAAQIIRSERLD
jgi:hypothetical protein